MEALAGMQSLEDVFGLGSDFRHDQAAYSYVSYGFHMHLDHAAATLLDKRFETANIWDVKAPRGGGQ